MTAFRTSASVGTFQNCIKFDVDLCGFGMCKRPPMFSCQLSVAKFLLMFRCHVLLSCLAIG